MQLRHSFEHFLVYPICPSSCPSSCPSVPPPVDQSIIKRRLLSFKCLTQYTSDFPSCHSSILLYSVFPSLSLPLHPSNCFSIPPIHISNYSSIHPIVFPYFYLPIQPSIITSLK